MDRRTQEPNEDYEHSERRAHASRHFAGSQESSDTDPMELIAAAHAGSFSLALSNELGSAGSASDHITTTATVTLEHLTVGWTIINIHLDVIAKLLKVGQCEFIDATVRAKTGCLITRLLHTNISMNAKLEN